MKDKLRELAERWTVYGSHMTGHECADELLVILDAEGDGVAVPDDDLPGMWSNADFTGGDPDERCHAARVSEADQFNAFRLAYYGANKSLAPEMESFRRAYQTIIQPARSGVVSEEDVRDGARLDWLLAHQNYRVQGKEESGWCVMDCGNGVSFVVRHAPTAREAIDVAIKGERHER